jgi:hypothetical protein
MTTLIQMRIVDPISNARIAMMMTRDTRSEEHLPKLAEEGESSRWDEMGVL